MLDLAAKPIKFIPDKKSAARKPRQLWTNYRCSDQGLAGFACHSSTAPDSGGKENQPGTARNNKLSFPSNGHRNIA